MPGHLSAQNISAFVDAGADCVLEKPIEHVIKGYSAPSKGDEF